MHDVWCMMTEWPAHSCLSIYIFFKQRDIRNPFQNILAQVSASFLLFSFSRSLLCVSLVFCFHSFSRWTFKAGSTVELRFRHLAIITSGIYFFFPFSEPVTTVLFLLYLSILVSPKEEPIPLLFDLCLLPGNNICESLDSISLSFCRLHWHWH